ncbi:MAG: hypothetical protein JSW34_03995 [Candidatus Zixiibacteriota bacterium]|nr:MAG: hypothetical protein JSW34_03995 [candidate division Zixibacteria bacterium]
MRRTIYIALATLLLAASAHGAKYAGEAFSLGVGGRGLALGGAFVAGPFDGTAPYWNPAGMNRLDGRYITAMHAETFGSLLNHDFVAYVNAARRENSVIQSFGFYLYYLGGGGIKITALNEFDRPYVVREESHGDYLLSAAVSGRISRKIDFGLTAKIIFRDLGTESGYGLTMDAGALYDLMDWASIGLMVTDITTGFIRYSGETFGTGANYETIYPTVKPGFMLRHSYRHFTGRFMASSDVKFESIKSSAQYWSGPVSVDTHYGWELSYRETVFGRAGFDIGNFTVGGGVDVKNITVDFAFLQHDDLEETYRVSAGYRF